MKRVGTLIASILIAVMDAVEIIASIISILVVIGLLSDLSGSGMSVALPVVFIQVLLVIFLLVGLILTCCTFKCFNATPEEYAKRKKVLIASMVFNFLIAILLFYGAASAEGATDIVVSILSGIVFVAGNVLYIVDLALEKKRVAKLTAPNETTTPTENTGE